MVSMINESRATVLVVGLGAGRQEKFIVRYRDRFPHVKTFLPLGGTIDYEAGTLARPAPWVTDAGFEWLYRLLREPQAAMAPLPGAPATGPPPARPAAPGALPGSIRRPLGLRQPPCPAGLHPPRQTANILPASSMSRKLAAHGNSRNHSSDLERLWRALLTTGWQCLIVIPADPSTSVDSVLGALRSVLSLEKSHTVDLVDGRGASMEDGESPRQAGRRRRIDGTARHRFHRSHHAEPGWASPWSGQPTPCF